MSAAVFQIHPGSGEPIYLQLVRQAKHGVATGILRRGDQLPTVRQLAADLRINARTVVRAYQELEAQGVIESIPGRGTFVAAPFTGLRLPERRRRLQPYLDQLFAEAAALGFAPEEVARLAEEEARRSERNRAPR